MNVLAIGAHPDDIEFLCAGTLALCAKRGDAVSICFLTTGDKGAVDIAPAEMAAIRREEAENSARIIGASLFPLGLGDGEVEVSMELRGRLAEVVRQAAPDLIITHYPQDYMSDHDWTSRLAVDVSFWAGARTSASATAGSRTPVTCPPVVCMDTLGGIGFLPQEYVDITEVMDVKIEMLSQHKSQVRFMKERDGLDVLDYMITAAKYRGYQCGVEYAEGFVPDRRYPSLSAKRLLP